MDKSPNNQKKPADSSQQEIGNKPLSGERPDQGEAMTNDHYDPQGKRRQTGDARTRYAGRKTYLSDPDSAT